mmetsp:Transcript_36315/g.104535  ORF Transcript_36315/g.104535 Transcript_36315/m.104535 type:complete len:269 (+) Transcript_36315:744-1550(+)
MEGQSSRVGVLQPRLVGNVLQRAVRATLRARLQRLLGNLRTDLWLLGVRLQGSVRMLGGVRLLGVRLLGVGLLDADLLLLLPGALRERGANAGGRGGPGLVRGLAGCARLVVGPRCAVAAQEVAKLDGRGHPAEGDLHPMLREHPILLAWEAALVLQRIQKCHAEVDMAVDGDFRRDRGGGRSAGETHPDHVALGPVVPFLLGPQLLEVEGAACDKFLPGRRAPGPDLHVHRPALLDVHEESLVKHGRSARVLHGPGVVDDVVAGIAR